MVSICNICLDEISEEDKKNITIICSNQHNIHQKCMQKWLVNSEKGICPSGCGEKLVFNLDGILLDEIDITSNNKQIILYDKAIDLLKNYIQLDKYILIDLAKLNPEIYLTPTNILSYNSPYSHIIDNLQELIHMYIELKSALINLNNIKHMDISINYETIRSLKNKLYFYEKILLDSRETVLSFYNINKLEKIEDIINRKIKNLSKPNHQSNNKSKTIVRLFQQLSLTLPSLKTALDPNILPGDINYVDIQDIAGILTLHRIVSVYYQK